jgi:hypothetical protein
MASPKRWYGQDRLRKYFSAKVLWRRYFQIADVLDGLLQVLTQKIGDLLAERVILKSQSSDISFAFIVYNQKTLTGY